jgi:subtilisin-like proprotein convertase family protein
MRFKPRTWFLVSLLLFAGAAWMWNHANNVNRGRQPGAPAKAAAGQSMPLVRVSTTGALGKGKSYHVSNTGQSVGQLLRSDHAIILRNALIDTSLPLKLDIPAHLRARGAAGSYIVQSDRPLNGEFYQALKKDGAAYVSYIPNNAALVSAGADEARQLAADPVFQTVLPYEPYYKLDSALLPAAVEQTPETNLLSVTTFPGQRDAALAALSGLGAKVVGEDRSPFGPTLVVSAPADSLAEVAQMPLAQEIERYSPRRLLNDLTRVQLGISANTLTNATNYLGLSGSNVMVNVNDTGVDATHPDFKGPNGLRLLGDTNDFDGHGTHVGGIIAGNGSESSTLTNPPPGSILGADMRGKATNATLLVQGLDLVTGPFISDAYLETNASAQMGKTNLISNNSWGYPSTVYDMHAASYDAATRDAQPGVSGEQPLLFVFAAGNNGNGDDSGLDGHAGTISSPGTAKNVLTVGTSDSPRFITNGVDYSTPLTNGTTNAVFYGGTDNSNLVAGFSSCGNVGVGVEGTYGRFKPDVVAPGVFTVSCRSTNYVDPTYENFLTVYPFAGQTVLPRQTNDYQLKLFSDTSLVIVQVSPNAASPSPFPPLLIYADAAPGPITTLVGTNIAVLSNGLAGVQWYFGIAEQTNFPHPVSYDLNIFVFETNTLGDYFIVLSNLNSVLKPYYLYQSGSSMSAAAVSGMLALMQEYLQTKLSMTNPSPALLKAMVINGSRSMNIFYDFNPNTEGPNEQGWGLPDITNCIPETLAGQDPSMLLIDQSTNDALATGQSQTYVINCGDGAASNFPIRVTLVWTDPPGDPAAGVALVNDLNLTVSNLSGASGSNVFIGNDFFSGDIFTEVNTGDAPDAINNVENVYISPVYTPFSFPLYVTVSAARVNVNAVTMETNLIAQDYALVISSDDPALASRLTITTNPVVRPPPVSLVTVAHSGVPLLHERVGANEPNLWNYAAGITNGSTNQWHFFVFTNDQFIGGTNKATNVAFTTFEPPNLSIPRNTDADIDMYVSTDPALTNLDAAAIEGADKSLNRGGNETIIYSNSVANEVYYIGIKSEDQQGADFGFYGVAQQLPFSTVNGNGSITAWGTGLPVVIPDSFAGQPALVFAFMVRPGAATSVTRKVTVNLGIIHGNPSDLYGTLNPDNTPVVLNNYSGPPGGFDNLYDDLLESPGEVPSDGPGTLKEYINTRAQVAWILQEADNALFQSGSITNFSVNYYPQPLGAYTITLCGGDWYDDYVNVPDDATNLNISVTYEGTSNSPVGIYITNTENVTVNDYGTNINAPGGSLNYSTTNVPPLSGGTWYYGFYNEGAACVTLNVLVQIQESLVPNLVNTYSNNTLTPLGTDSTTGSQICITNGQQVVDLSVGVRLNDPNLDDLVLHLTSPQGTSVLLFENRGGLLATNLGLSLVGTNPVNTNVLVTNYVYTTFTEDTNLATVPIKFAWPFASNNAVTNISLLSSNGFEGLTNGIYTAGQSVGGGWGVATNEVGIVTDPNGAYSGTNYLALTSGQITNTFPTVPGATYELTYYAKPPGIVGWWPGDHNTDDIVNNENGTLSPSGASYAAGMVGQAFLFDGANGYVQVPDSPTLKPANVTAEAWVWLDPNLPSNNGGEQIVFKKNTWSAWFEGYSFLKETAANSDGTYSDHFYFVVSRFGDQVVINSQTIAQRGVWYHVAATYDGNQSTLYVNGVAEASATAGFALDYDTTPLFIGTTGTWVPYLNMFGGKIDECSIYNRALSVGELAAIYRAGSLGKYSTTSLYPNFQVVVDGVSTNTVILTNFTGGWQLHTNSFIATNAQTTIELAGNTLSTLFDNIELVQLPYTNYDNYYLPEEPLTPFIGENPQGCWTLDIWDTRLDSPLPANGALLSWTLEMTTSSTNVNLILLTNDVPFVETIPVPAGQIVYFGVDVPETANFATNILTNITGAGAPLNLLFDQSALPTGTLAGDVTLMAGVSTAQTNTLTTEGAPPPLEPGRRYFLGVQNPGPGAARFSLQVDFDVSANTNIIALTNGVAFTNIANNNGPQFYSFTVPANAVLASFQVLNTPSAELDLFAREGLPVPGPLSFEYDSRNAGTNDQFIVVTTNSLPVPLPLTPTTWYLSVYNFGNVASAGYTIEAAYVTNGELTVIPLANGVPKHGLAPPGFLGNLYYSFTVTNTSEAGVQFTVTNISPGGDLELLVGDGTLPTPEASFSESFAPGAASQFVSIGTNAALPTVEGTWYLAVPNNSGATLGYSIIATNVATVVPNAPAFLGASIASPTNGFTMYWSAVPGQVYEIDVSTNLTAWTEVTNITAQSAVGAYTDAVPVSTQKSRFFRLSTTP